MRTGGLWVLLWVKKRESKTSQGQDLEHKHLDATMYWEILTSGLAWVFFILFTRAHFHPPPLLLLFPPFSSFSPPFLLSPFREAWLLHLWSSSVASNGWSSDQVNLCLHPLLGKWRLSLCPEPTWNCGSGLRGVHFSCENANGASLGTCYLCWPFPWCIWLFMEYVCVSDGLMDMQIERPGGRTQEWIACRKWLCALL